MERTVGLIFVHIWLILWVVIFSGFIWGNLAEKAYYARMKLGKWINLRKWSKKESFVRWMKRFSYFALPFGILLYLFTLRDILSKKMF